jgi:hypothetical protein
MREMAVASSLALVPTAAIAASAPNPRQLISLHAFKFAEALNSACGGAWEVNICPMKGFILIIDRKTPGNVRHDVQS